MGDKNPNKLKKKKKIVEKNIAEITTVATKVKARKPKK